MVGSMSAEQRAMKVTSKIISPNASRMTVWWLMDHGGETRVLFGGRNQELRVEYFKFEEPIQFGVQRSPHQFRSRLCTDTV
jgi:hypothetical protein